MTKASDYFQGTLREFALAHTYLEIFAEFLGTFLFVAFGMGSAQLFGRGHDRVQVGLCFGIAVGAAMTVIQHISGGHLNPAVTISQTLFGRIYVLKALVYVIVQCLGSMCGAGVIRLTLPDYKSNDGVTRINGISQGQGLVIEMVMAFILMLIVEACTDPGRPDLYPGGAAMIGFTISACIISIMPWTGGSLNPARSTGAAVVMAEYDDLWIYWIGPVAGAILGSLVYTLMYRVGSRNKDDED